MPHERIHPRTVEVDVCVSYQQPLLSDAIEEAVNYVHVAETVSATLVNGGFSLLETAAAAISSALFHRYALIDQVTVVIRKRGSISGGDCAYARFVARREDVS